MENHEESIRKIESRIWQLILLAVVVILYLTLSPLTMSLPNFLAKSDSILSSENAYKLSIFLSVLILFFCGHMIVQHRKIMTLSRKVMNADETARDLDRDVMTLSALLEVSSSINSQKRLSDILKIITREMLRCFNAHHASIMLVERQKKILQTKASVGKGTEFTKDAQLPIGEGIAGWVVKNGKPLLLNGEVDPIDFPGAKKMMRNISSAMCLPLKIDKECIGVLNVNLIESEKTFSENDLKLTMVFANSAAVAIHNAILMAEKHQRIRFQTMLEQLHSPQVAKELVNKIEDWKHPNNMREKVEMTILFADIRGFSQMMSHVEPDEAIIEFLDEYYSTTTRVVFESGGSINKFIGDEVMAFFGGPIAFENPTENGVGAALDIVKSFTCLKEKFSVISPHFGNLGIGIGINTGTVFVGNVGSKERYDYTLIGNAVNVARRLCSHAAPNEILAGTKTVKGLKGKHVYRFIEKRSFKGIPHDIDVYRLQEDQIYRSWVNVRGESRTSRQKRREMKAI